MSLRPDPAAFVNPADLWARAIIAAARAYGDDPVEALAGTAQRRCLQAACLGIVQATGLSIGEVASRLGLQPSAVRRMKTEGNREFKAAWRSAARAADYACWRPEAAESVVQAVGEMDRVGEAGVEVIAPEAAPLPEPAPKPARLARPHAPLAGRVNLANGHAFTPAFRPGPPPPTQSLEARILARLGQAPTCPRSLASILGVKESFVDQTLRVLGLEGRVIAGETPPGASPRETAWSLA
ncbi:hypothetical protein [Phenylobacterium sp.]|uniref:hypothetical protein n=1 Tax=Phenylobacterium sp. TaxID=1871053 RepID=UPI0025F3FBAC|nr:hypothetical protein [Phenylobacterium sp.]MCA3716474.1 hypothetical protein [Phenylobacterium sp.]